MVKKATVTEDYNLFGHAATISHDRDANKLSKSELNVILDHGPDIGDFLALKGIIHEGIEIEVDPVFGMSSEETDDRVMAAHYALAEKLQWKFHNWHDPKVAYSELFTDKGVLILTWEENTFSRRKRWVLTNKVQFSEIYGS